MARPRNPHPKVPNHKVAERHGGFSALEKPPNYPGQALGPPTLPGGAWSRGRHDRGAYRRRHRSPTRLSRELWPRIGSTPSGDQSAASAGGISRAGLQRRQDKSPGIQPTPAGNTLVEVADNPDEDPEADRTSAGPIPVTP